MKIRHVTLFSLLLLCPACMGQWQTGAKPPLGTQIDWSDPINRGLVGYWLMNEGAGDRIYDLSGNGRTGTITAGTWAAGPDGPCLAFTQASSSNISLGDLKGLEGEAAITLAGWFRSNENANASVADNIWKKSGSGTDTLAVSWDQSDYIPFSLTNAAEARVTVNSNPIKNWLTWHFITCVYDGAYLYVYVDGKLACTPAAQTGLVYTSAHTFYIGDNSANTWNGLVGLQYFYNRALSPSEIARLYREPFAGFQRERPELCVSAGGGEPPAAGRVQVIFISGIPVWVTLAMVSACVWDMKQRREAA